MPFSPNWLLKSSLSYSKGSSLVDFGTILSYARKTWKGSRTLTLCQGQRSCRAKNRKKTLSYDFPKLHHSKTNNYCANVHLRQSFWKTVKVTKRSCDVTPRSKYQQSKGHPWSPCASNLVQSRLSFTKLRHFEKNGTRHLSLIGRHLERVSRTIPVFKHTLAPSEKWPTQEISVRFGPFFYRVIVLTSQDAMHSRPNFPTSYLQWSLSLLQ